jgi:hypothetical protein
MAFAMTLVAFAVAFAFSVSSTVAMSFAMGFVPPAAVFAVVGNIDVVVPDVIHKIDRLAAGVVSVAMLAPVLGVAGRDPEIERRQDYAHGRRADEDRLRIDESRLRDVADIEPAIETRLSDADGDTDVGGVRRTDGCGQHRREEEAFHV